MNLKKNNLLLICAVVEMFLGVLGLILCTLPAIKLGNIDGMSIYELIFDYDKKGFADSEVLKTYLYFIGPCSFCSSFSVGIFTFIQLFNNSLNKRFFKLNKGYRKEELIRKAKNSNIIGGTFIFFLYLIAAIIFLSTKSIFLFNEEAFKLGNGAVCCAIVCLILSCIMILHSYINNEIMKEQVENIFKPISNIEEINKQ